MTNAHDLGANIRDSLYVIVDHFVASLPDGVKALNTGGMPGSASKEAPLPVSAHVLDVRAMCCDRLAGWARVALEERQLAHASLQAGDALGLARFLMVHSEWLGGHEAGQDAADEIDTSARELKALVYDLGSRRFPVGTCPERGTSEAGERIPCPGNLKATLRKDDTKVPSAVGCDYDPAHAWSAGEWMQLGKRVNPTGERTA